MWLILLTSLTGIPGGSPPRAVHSSIDPSVSLVVVYVDFPDGRLPDGSLTSLDADSSRVENIDAVGSMGWVPSENPSTSGEYRKKIRKYTYEDYWDPVFSIGEYRGPLHPDYGSHQAYQPSKEEDKRQERYNLEVFGSVRDYWREVSDGKFDIVPFQTHPGRNDKYHTGIVNNVVMDSSGRRFIRWIRLPYPKAAYNFGPTGYDRDAMPDALTILDSLHNRTAESDPNHLDFDIRSYDAANQKVGFITAGGRLGGWATLGGKYFIIPEKMQYFQNTDPASLFNPITEFAHEFGHTLGIPHQAVGPYDIMHWGGLALRRNYFCPPHINPKLKMELGWISPGDVIVVDSDRVVALPPIDRSPRVAQIMMRPRRGTRMTGSGECLIVEYRLREGFNRYCGGLDTSFHGGALIWHVLVGGEIPFASNDDLRRNLGLEVRNYGDAFKGSPGSPADFFYERNPTLDGSTNPGTNSIDGTATGISLSNFTTSPDSLRFVVRYER